MRAIWLTIGSLLLLSCGSGTTPPAPSSPIAPAHTTISYSISGTVRDDAGAPLEGATVTGGILYSKSGPLFLSQTDPQGRYAGRLPPGLFDISARKPGFDSLAQSNVAVSGDMVIDFTLRPGVSIGGIVTEAGVGPLAGATIEILTGPNAGRSTLSGPPGVPGSYGFQHLVPGDFTLRAKKAGYAGVEQSVHAPIDTYNLDFTLKWDYGSCLVSVAPVLFDFYPSEGGTESVEVTANAGRSWSVTADSPWIEPLSPSQATGTGRAVFRVRASAPGATDVRQGALMIRCSPSEGQNVWISQVPDCQLTLTAAGDTPAAFGAAGGIGHVHVHTGIPACWWEARSQADWLRTIGVKSWHGDFELAFVVEPNATGSSRTGTIVVNDSRWQVKQQ